MGEKATYHPRQRPGVRLPLLLSLAVHGAFLLPICLLPKSDEANPRLSINPVRLDTGETLTLAPVPEPERRKALQKPSEPQEEFVARVVEPAPLSAPAVLPSATNLGHANGAGHTPETGPAESGPGSAPGNGGLGSSGPTFFGVPASGQTVVYLLDRSFSMGPSRALECAKHELLAGLARLPVATRFQIIPYNRHADPLRINNSTALLPATADHLGQVALQLKDQEATGGTNHLEALLRGLAYQPNVLFLITDADDLQPADVRKATQVNQGRTVIHAIELNRRSAARPDSPLRQLAAANGGTYRHVTPD
jgi:hypothetical protein